MAVFHFLTVSCIKSFFRLRNQTSAFYLETGLENPHAPHSVLYIHTLKKCLSRSSSLKPFVFLIHWWFSDGTHCRLFVKMQQAGRILHPSVIRFKRGHLDTDKLFQCQGRPDLLLMLGLKHLREGKGERRREEKEKKKLEFNLPRKNQKASQTNRCRCSNTKLRSKITRSESGN